MATVKVKFQPSTVSTREGSVYFQIIHNRVARQIKTGYRLFRSEWNSLFESSFPCGEREAFLVSVRNGVSEDTRRLERIIRAFNMRDEPYTADDVVQTFKTLREDAVTFFSFMRMVIMQMKGLGKVRTGESYTSTLNSFVRFRGGADIPLQSVDNDLICAYEAYLKKAGVCKNSSSFYMRNLRSVYNRAVDKGLVEQSSPFRHVYTGIDKTVKRAIPLTTVRRIKNLELSDTPMLDFARDMFMFSFYTRGMSFVDMSFLLKSDLQNGVLTYRRKKTGQKLTIRWEKCMQELVDKYDTRSSPYLLPILKPDGGDMRRQYRNVAHLINKKLKTIGTQVQLSIPLTMYVARHGWASVARSKNVPLSVISEGMGHDSEMTTRIYLASLDTNIVDKANRLILRSL